MPAAISKRQVDAIKAAFGMGRHEWYGHSLAIGASGSEADKDTATHLASAFGAQEVNRAVAGAVVQFANQAAGEGSGNGGWQRVFQYARNQFRPYGTLAANVAANAVQIVVNDPPSAGPGVTADSAWTGGRMLMIGTGANGEIAQEFSVSGPNTPSAGQRTITSDRTLTGGQSSGDPVWEIPSRWHSLAPFYGCWFGLNDLAAQGTAPPATYTNKTGERGFKHSYRAVLARLCCGEAYHAGHRSLGRSTQAATAGLNNDANWGGWFRALFTVGNQITIEVPANYKGNRRIFVWFVVQAGSGVVVNFTVDGGSTVATLDDTATGDVNGIYVMSCVIIPPQAAGRHVIVGTVASNEGGVGNHYNLGWGIEAEQPPVILAPGMHKPASYYLYGTPNTTNGKSAQVKGTLTAGVSSGNSVAVSAPLGSTSGAAGTIRQGEYLTIEPGTGNEERVVVTSADLAIAGTVTVSPAITKTHANGAAYIANMSDAAVDRAKPWVPAVIGEFGPNIAYVDVDALINKDPNLMIQDGIHLNDEGTALVAAKGIETLYRLAAMDPASIARTSVPIAPYPEEMQLIGKGASVVGTSIGAAGAVTEFPAGAASVYRWEGDLRRASTARFWLNHTAGVPAGSPRARLEYSLDAGTTWKTLAKKLNGYETDIATATEPGQIDLTATSTATKWTSWFQLPPDLSFVPNVVVRLVTGNRSSGVVFPTFTGAGFQLL